MYGLILSNFSGYLIQKYGEEAWDNIRRLANIDNATFTMHQTYPEQLLGRIAKVGLTYQVPYVTCHKCTARSSVDQFAQIIFP